MREIIITSADASRRLDKFLLSYMNKAHKSFLYKMLRTKRIKLNKARAEGNEILSSGDIINIYLPEEAIVPLMEEKRLNLKAGSIKIIYEDDNLLICDKPPGVLSHPESPGDTDTMIDRILLYLIQTGAYQPSAGSSFTPALCNRLDRNTGGLVVCGKTLQAVQAVNLALKKREVDKLYRAAVRGIIREEITIDAALLKDGGTNKVSVSDSEGAAAAKTIVRPLAGAGGKTLVELSLITGRTHQLRAHLASIGHPILGDVKYGGQAESGLKGYYRLYAYSLRFNDMEEPLAYLNGKTIKTDLPGWADSENFGGH